MKSTNILKPTINILKVIASISTLIIITLIIMFSDNVWAQKKYEVYCNDNLKKLSLKIALKEVGTIEKNNKNDGNIAKYLKPFNLKTGNPYCAAGQYYCFIIAANKLKLNNNQIPIKKTALAQEIYNTAKKQGNKTKFTPKIHDLIIWRKPNSHKGHIERIYEVLNKGWVKTIAFNSTKIINGKKQEGVFIQKRNIKHPLGRLKIKGLVGFKN